ncbi:hypothetical protein HAX54_045730, partial [Datura stramonium]|nr:hypothetical protein [Datura stramonium]
MPWPKQVERMWLDFIGGPSRYGISYCMTQRTFHEFHSRLQRPRLGKGRRDIEYAGIKALDALLASEGGGFHLVQMQSALLDLLVSPIHHQ